MSEYCFQTDLYKLNFTLKMFSAIKTRTELIKSFVDLVDIYQQKQLEQLVK